MGSLKKREQAAIEAVAGRFSATWEGSDGPSGTCLTIAGKRVVLELAAPRGWAGDHRGGPRPRLRFDKVAARLVEHVQTALREEVPDGVTVLLAITAPIRLPSRTATALEDRVRDLLARRSGPAVENGTIHGNGVRIRVVRCGVDPAPKVIGFVHSPGTDPRLLLDLTRSLLEVLRARSGGRAANPLRRDRWLVVIDEGEPWHLDLCRSICSQARMPGGFRKVLMVSAGARVEELG